MAKFEPARGPGSFGLVAGRDWLLRFRPDFLAGLAGWACAGLDQKRDGFGVRARGSAQTLSLWLELSPTNETKRNGDLFRLLFRWVQMWYLPASFLIRSVNFDLSQLHHACSSYPRLIKEESLLGFIFFLHLLTSQHRTSQYSNNGVSTAIILCILHRPSCLLRFSRFSWTSRLWICGKLADLVTL